MEQMNRSAYQWVVGRLSDQSPKHILEIGFGTGGFLELCADRLAPECLYGVDPAELMHTQATQRLTARRNNVASDLRLGTDEDIDWPDGSIDAVTALHAFQFWTNPQATLKRLHMMLAPGGQLVLVLRLHGNNPPDWLPNPLSKSGDEVGSAVSALQDAGFNLTETAKLGAGSFAIVAAKA